MTFGKRLATALLLLALVGQSFSKAIVIADFYANQDYIARNLCINRMNTAIHCGGQCQLNKRMKQQEKDNDSSERKPDKGNEIVISSRSFYLINVIPYRPLSFRMYPPARSSRPIDRPSNHFHPPDRIKKY